MNIKNKNSNDNNLQEASPEIKDLISEIKKDDNFGAAIEKIFANEKDPKVIKEKIIAVLKAYLKTKHKDKNKKEIEEIEKQIEKDINRISQKFIDNLMQNLDIDTAQSKNSDLKAKNDYKRILKNFIVFKIYQVMNPKRIAGETKKDNYKHNLSRGGEKLANKYEGGKPNDLKKYGEAEVKNIKSQVATFKKNEGRVR